MSPDVKHCQGRGRGFESFARSISCREDVDQAFQLYGAAAIAEELFNDPETRDSVYHHSKNSRLPTFKLGGQTCARKSVLLKWIEDQERQSLGGVTPPQRGPSDDEGVGGSSLAPA
jgi:hypothetical protein